MSSPSRIAVLALMATSCGPRASKQPMYPAGSDNDDGHGILARASSTLMTGDETSDDLAAKSPPAVPRRYED
jgi:hypothetical protein